jgi:hypothetical protein
MAQRWLSRPSVPYSLPSGSRSEHRSVEVSIVIEGPRRGFGVRLGSWLGQSQRTPCFAGRTSCGRAVVSS